MPRLKAQGSSTRRSHACTSAMVEEEVASPTWSSRSSSSRKSAHAPQHESAEQLLRHYSLGDQLGAGSFARVHHVKDKNTGEERVCKLVSTLGSRRLEPREIFELTRREVRLLRDLDHPHIVKLFEYAEDARRGELAIILEYLPGGTCLDLMTSSGGCLSEALVTRLIHQLLLALGYCHMNGVVHRDIKPDNIMLTQATSWSLPDCKLIDFGLASSIDGPDEVLGTPSYIAPEVVSERASYTFGSDMWSLGVTTAELLTGINPFGKPQDFGGRDEPIVEQVLAFKSVSDLEQRGRLKWNLSCSQASRKFVRSLLIADAAERPAATTALANPWLQSQKPTPASLTSGMLNSLARFSSAPPLAAMCLHIIVARSAVPLHLGAAFLGTDINGDGQISYKDLQEAVRQARKWWDPEVDVDRLLPRSGAERPSWTFTEFATACLYGQQGSLKELVTCAFAVLDDNRDGIVPLDAIRSFFPEDDLHKLCLPEGDSFTLDEWLHCSKRCWLPADAGMDTSNSLQRFISQFYCGASAQMVQQGEIIYTRVDHFAFDERGDKLVAVNL